MSKDRDDQLHAMRHSLAHIMAAAIKHLYPNVQFGVGPTTSDGFYYDVDFGSDTIGPEELSVIESKMRAIIKKDIPFEQYDLSLTDAKQWAKDSGQDYKLELLEDLESKGTTVLSDVDEGTIDNDVEKASFYRCGDFEDLCRGPHVDSTGSVGAFKLHKLAGAYWRGDETRPQLQRVYGLAFSTQEELDEYIQRMKEAEERDHRKLGAELDLLAFSDLVGSGLPLFTPKGTVLRDLLGRYTQQLRKDRGFEQVWIPHMTKTDLYKKSGHWDKFGEELFIVNSQETTDELVLKPMNCPHHAQIYASQQRSYRDLPVKYMENTTVYRDEKSGELHGLSRVRSITQDDSHVFATANQVADSVTELVEAAKELYAQIDMELRLRLSFRDESDAYLGDPELWDRAQEELEQIAKAQKLDYYTEEGEAAFYGPKLDFMAVDAMDREWQVATVQLDFVQPQRFELEYVDEEGQRRAPVMIHAALLGSFERFLSIYIEHTAGRFPIWLAPEQVRVLSINDAVLPYIDKITTELSGVVLSQPVKYNELRHTVDSRNESLGKKIREAETAKVPIILIVGPKDEADEVVSVRVSGEEKKVPIEELAEFIASL